MDPEAHSLQAPGEDDARRGFFVCRMPEKCVSLSISFMSRWLEKIGEITLEKLGAHALVAGTIWAVIKMLTDPYAWRRPVRVVLARQILFSGVLAARFIALIALTIGVLVVVQMQVWLARVGQSTLLGPVLVMAIMRELGPLLVNFVVLGRSGTAVAAELGNMRINGEVEVLDSQGIDPFVYLVFPRVVGMSVSVFCLTVLFVLVSFLGGYIAGLLLGFKPGPFVLFVESVFRAITPADVVNLVVKTFLPGAMTGAICCIEGLSASQATTEVPQVTTRAVVRSVSALVVVSAVMSVLTYT